MIAVDTNLLVYAHRFDAPQNDRAYAALRGLALGRRPWGLPWPCVHEFVAAVTSVALARGPQAVDRAFRQVRAWQASPSCRILGETPRHLEVLRSILPRAAPLGGVVHDARIAAICLEHDVSELWSADTDMRRFPGLRIVNPLAP